MSKQHSATTDTIVAIATAPGRGGIGVVRLSGPQALAIGEAVCGQSLPPRQGVFCAFRDSATVLDRGIALAFPAPASFTGEDVVELQAHGSPVVLDMLLRACCGLGARLARPGEFSERAFLNGKMDLAQAEAVADLIASTTESGARSAARSLQGAFSRAVDALMEDVVSLRVFVEAAIDFPEEEIDFLKQGEVGQKLEALLQKLGDVTDAARQGSLIQQGMKLVIAGKPNAGKSSLLNALSGQDAAIVAATAGTTRDVLRENVQVDGLPLHIVDTAGLRDSEEAIEQEGVRRAWKEMETADRILLVVDSNESAGSTGEGESARTAGEGESTGAARRDVRELWPELQEPPLASIPLTIIHNKCDLTGEQPGISGRGPNANIQTSATDEQPGISGREPRGDATIVTLSAKTGAGIDLLKKHLTQAAGFDADTEPPFLARRRHLDALERARTCLEQAQAQMANHGAGELVAEDLRHCHDNLGEITGAMSSDDLLGHIFSSFCIGK